ncbi:thioredoxin domain-containing protein [Flavobacterium agricola]|uniref:Thioredoxin domain-containing protein n=1 Tax=Flavobacterium agricola TaxID=2870839 RepID=A0ABY6LZ81_9FLAO|nr:thioredoxin domain-containing protein [Flavobacterium agricola]UYW00750.1 thioredoxin domain-containing protein [Flavobacterium agricola]
MNLLHLETSPYLLQHQNNPIYWKAWNAKTLAQAKQENKLLLVSVGYSACHWCHVMEHECFEDDEVAQVMNAHYVAIKVDREERPDVDAIYMKALQLMTRQGGWPLNVVCLPDGRPIWGATYVNKLEWIDTLQQLQNLFETNYEKVLDYAEKLQLGINHIGLVENKDVAPNNLDSKQIEPLLKNWKRSFDWDYGGPARAPKFMMPTNLNFLQSYGSLKQDNELLDYVDLTLTKMAQGGLFDVVEGGFSRYSVDMRWHIPHFEKMLYDNGQLLETYANAYKRTKNENYKTVCEKNIKFIETNWLAPNGLVYSAYDADSLNDQNKMQEGAFYFWTKKELKHLLKDDFNWFELLYNVNDFGFWEDDFYVLIQSQSIAQIAEQVQIPLAELEIKNKEALNLLKQHRLANRQKPGLDDKCLTSWNAMWVIGLLTCYEAFKNENYINLAKQTLDAILNKMLNPDTGILYRNAKNNNVNISGFLEDYAFTTKALLKMYQNTLQESYLQTAKQFTDYCLDHFYEPQIGLFEFKNKQDEALIAKHYEIEDNVVPSANAIMGQNLWILHLIYQHDFYKSTAIKMLQLVIPSIDYASAFSDWLQLLLWVQNDAEHVIFTGKDAKEHVLNELEKWQHSVGIWGTTTTSSLPIFSLKHDANKNQKFICNNTSCQVHEVI